LRVNYAYSISTRYETSIALDDYHEVLSADSSGGVVPGDLVCATTVYSRTFNPDAPSREYIYARQAFASTFGGDNWIDFARLSSDGLSLLLCSQSISNVGCVGPEFISVRFCNPPVIGCSGCFDVESFSILGSTAFTSQFTCSDGIPSVDGTYPMDALTQGAGSRPKPCNAFRVFDFGQCLPLPSSPPFGFTDARGGFFIYDANVPKPFETLPSPNSIIVPYPYYSPSRGFRLIVNVEYNSRFVGSLGDGSDSHVYLRDFETCPEGTVEIPYLTTYHPSASDMGSTAPASVFVTWPSL
jgi:hypothetical protein